MLKHITLMVALLAIAGNSLFAQGGGSSLASDMRLDFAVPDMPAFSMLEDNPSHILRPSTPQDFSVIARDFNVGNGPLSLPQNFAAELSPGSFLAGNKLTLARYDKHYLLYNTRLSVGTKQPNDGSEETQLAFGLRTTLIDKGDIKGNAQLRSQLFAKLDATATSKDALQQQWMKANNVTIIQLAQDSSLQGQMEAWITKQQKNQPGVKQLLDEFKSKHWNALKWDVALGALGQSADTLVRNVSFDQLGLWTTLGLPLNGKNGNAWGQLLIGFNANMDFRAEVADYYTFALPLRLYAGSNKIKGFLEAQASYNHNTLKEGEPGSGGVSNGLINSGLELNVMDGLWLTANAGWQITGLNQNSTNSGFTSHFDLRFRLPEKLNLF